MLKFGSVGSVRGGGFFRILRDLPHVQVVAACEPRPEAAADVRASRIAAVDDNYERFLSRYLDVVFVATPPALRALQAIQALASGRHVLSEVPAAHTLHECVELARSVQRSGRMYMLAETYRFSRTAETVKRTSQAGLFGAIYNAVAEYLHESRSLADGRDGGPTWRTIYPQVQYTTLNLGPVLWIMNQHVIRACALDSASRYPAMQRRDVAAALFQISGGGGVQFRIDGHSPRLHKMPYFAIKAHTAPSRPNAVWATRPRSTSRRPVLPASGSRSPTTSHGSWVRSGSTFPVGRPMAATARRSPSCSAPW